MLEFEARWGRSWARRAWRWRCSRAREGGDLGWDGRDLGWDTKFRSMIGSLVETCCLIES